jgi:hypothetical protein
LATYFAAALLWYYATTTVLNDYRAICQLDRGPFLVKMVVSSTQSFLIWTAPLLVARGRIAVWTNIFFGFVVLGAAILFAISAHNAPDCTMNDVPHIDSSGWFEFDSTSDLSVFICYLATLVDLLRWGRSKVKSASKADR